MIKIEMKLVKSTKNTHVYGCEGASIPTVYIEKDALPKPAPEYITISVEVGQLKNG